MAIFDRSKEYEQLRKDVIRANKSIARIEKMYGEDSWGVSRLYSRLDNEQFRGITKTGKIRLNKNMSDIQLKAIQKATTSFLSNKKTSTLTGIKGVIKDVKSSLRGTLGDFEHPISTRDINKLYDLVEDKDKRIITEQIGASDTWATLVEAKERKLDKNKFLDLIDKRTQADIRDIDTLNFLEDIYNNYVIISDNV